MLMSNATMEEKAFFELLDRSISTARLQFAMSDRTVNVGRSANPPEQVDFVFRINDPSFFRRVITEGNLGLAETFMNEGWTVEKGTLEDFLLLLLRSRVDEKIKGDPKLFLRMGALRVKQLIAGARANVQAHYDVGEELYDAFLDETRGYTCGYQKTEQDSLETLQENKYDRICQKLRLREGETLFDIGCGYGGLLVHAARNYGVKARGITNSNAHGEVGMRRARALGIEDRVTIEIGDFREARGTYDKVVSVGMFEHLYPHEHKAFFSTVKRILSEDGFGLLHCLGCVTATNDHDPFIQKYIFPGSTQNPLSTVVRQLERHKLAVLDVENMGKHYGPTTKAWLARFREKRHALDPKRYPPTFVRMWEYYLSLCVAGSQGSDGAVHQIVYTPNYRRDLPLHRV